MTKNQPICYALSCALSAVAVLSHPGHASALQDPEEEQDDEVRERLIRKGMGAEDEDIMTKIMREMSACVERLGEFFDPGEKTQELQKQILKDLDIAIEQARQNTSKRQSSAPQKTDSAEEGQADSDQDSSKSESSSSSSAGTPGSEADDRDGLRSGNLREQRRTWGNLPPRDRAEILQGVNEDILEMYRLQIEQYYEALSKIEAEVAAPE